MLRSLRIENHRSFRDESQLLLMPVDKKQPTVPVAAVFGANAGGKSNLLDGLRYMAEAVSDSYGRWGRSDGTQRRPFLFDAASSERPSTFVVELVLDSVRHVYGFVVDDDRVLEEWLYAYPKGRRRVLLERQGDELSFGSTIDHRRGRVEILRELTRPNALFLSLSAQVDNLGQNDLLPVHRWFTERLRQLPARTVDGTALARGVEEFLAEDVSARPQLIGLLRAADLGLRDLSIEYLVTKPTTASEKKFDIKATPQLAFEHAVDAPHLHVQDESAGTVRWLWTLMPVLRALRDGGLVAVDELDASLHPTLAARLVLLFRDPEANPHGAQLLFTSHDATLLGTSFGDEVLARDQIWFVEKDRDGSSSLYPLTDFHPRREGENRERRYLGGSYGGLPMLSELQFLDAAAGREDLGARKA